MSKKFVIQIRILDILYFAETLGLGIPWKLCLDIFCGFNETTETIYKGYLQKEKIRSSKFRMFKIFFFDFENQENQKFFKS